MIKEYATFLYYIIIFVLIGHLLLVSNYLIPTILLIAFLILVVMFGSIFHDVVRHSYSNRTTERPTRKQRR
jgi:uncharacterized membrane protein